MSNVKNTLADFLRNNESLILKEWLEEQLKSVSSRLDLIQKKDLSDQSAEFLSLFSEAYMNDPSGSFERQEWARVKEMLADITRSRAVQGFTPSETAIFIFSLKQPLINNLKQINNGNVGGLQDEIWNITILLDKLGLFTTEVFIKSKEEIIARQQLEMIELSTPVVQLWNGVLALPLIGTLDSARTQVVMENLLTKIVETGSFVAIIDITGVPTVDTLVAQHLLKTVAAARLMGADCIISGIRPQIAQTIVHLGVDLEEVTTKATMADAFKMALFQKGETVVKLNSEQRHR